MIRKHKKFARPRKLYDSPRIAEENKLMYKYGLKNKREIWKTEAKVRYFRNRAKKLITAPHDEQKIFFAKLKSIGLDVNSIADALALTKEDLLKRRLNMILLKKGLATTAQQARQMVNHKRIVIGQGVVSAPGYFVKVQEEPHITVRSKNTKEKKE